MEVSVIMATIDMIIKVATGFALHVICQRVGETPKGWTVEAV